MDTVPVNAAKRELNDQELAKLEDELISQLTSTPSEEGITSESPSASDEQQPASTVEEQPSTPTNEQEGQPEPKEEVKGEEAVQAQDFNDEDVKRLSEKAQKRYEKITKENREMREQLAALQQRLAGIAPQPKQETKVAPLPWEQPQQEADRELTEDELRQEIERKAREIVRTELENEKIVANLQSDISECETRYPELNPMSNTYDEQLADKLIQWYKSQVATNPHLRLKDFVSDFMSLRSKAADEVKRNVTGKVIQQASQQALGPAPVKSDTNNFEQLLSNARSVSDLEKLESLFQ